MAGLANLVLVRDKDIEEAVKVNLAKSGKTLEDFSKEWANRRIPRSIAAGTVTKNLVYKHMKEWQEKICPITGESPVSAELWKVYEDQQDNRYQVDGKRVNVFDLMQGEGLPTFAGSCWSLQVLHFNTCAGCHCVSLLV